MIFIQFSVCIIALGVVKMLTFCDNNVFALWFEFFFSLASMKMRVNQLRTSNIYSSLLTIIE